MNKPAEIPGVTLGVASMALFWVPPVGLALGVAGLAFTLSRRSQKRSLFTLALVTSILGVVAFAAFWGTIWALSQ